MTEAAPPLRVSVIGAARASEDEYEAARAVGAGLAEAGAVVVCGGHGGVMEGVARGAAEAGGRSIGILPGRDPDAANGWITYPLPTGMGEARNAIVVGAGEAVVAIGGAWGTLSEIALARTMGLEVGTLGRPPARALGLPSFEGAAEAVDWALSAAHRRRSG